MPVLHSDHPNCRRCGLEVDRGVEICPHCDYNPRDRGFRLGTFTLIATIIFFSAAILLGNYFPHLSAYMIVGSFLGFFATAIIVIASFIVKPYHLTTIFS